mgnify:CR=1 FL=1|jgi:hypothetical protein
MRTLKLPLPAVTREMVVAKAEQVFPSDPTEEVMAVLDRYGIEKWEPARERVQMAVLALSRGDRSELERYTEIARQDYRDALCAEEFRWLSGGGEIDPLCRQEQAVNAA